MGNHEDIFSGSKVITSADLHGDTIKLRAQNEVRRRCIFFFFCFYIRLIPYLAASFFYLYFDLVNTLLRGYRSWVTLDHCVSRTQVSVMFTAHNRRL
jgi:small-conductance mechanosensitive channel